VTGVQTCALPIYLLPPLAHRSRMDARLRLHLSYAARRRSRFRAARFALSVQRLGQVSELRARRKPPAFALCNRSSLMRLKTSTAWCSKADRLTSTAAER